MSASSPDTARAHQRHLPHVIAIASGKGGVGKTSISVNLAISLAKTGQRVCILDADTGLANVNILLGLAPQFTLEHVLFGAKTIEEVLLPGPFGVKVIPGANGISECVTLHPRQQMRLTRELARIEADFDYLILDTAAGIADNTLDFASAAHQTLVVITPEPTSLTDAFSLIKLLHRRRGIAAFQIVVNMASSATQAREVFHRFNAAVEKYIGTPTQLLGFLLLDESLRNAVSLQHPVALFPDTDPSSRSFVRLADALRQQIDAAGAAPANGFADFWQRQFREYSTQEDTAKETGGSNAPRPAPNINPRASVESYIGELKARLLVLLEKPDAPPQLLADLLNAVDAAYAERFDRGAMSLADGVQRLLQHSTQHEHELRELAAQLQPWAPAPAAPITEWVTQPIQPQTVAPAIVAQPVPVATMVKTPPPIHRYNEGRFGSQPTLLELLRRQADSGKSALELIDILR